MLWCYHLPVYDWTPLSQDPCWRCCVICAFWMCRTRQTITACVHSSRLSQKTTGFIIAWIGRLKSWENDPEGSGCCKCWEWSLYHDPLRHSPRLTICPLSFYNHLLLFISFIYFQSSHHALFLFNDFIWFLICRSMLPFFHVLVVLIHLVLFVFGVVTHVFRALLFDFGCI